MSLRIYNTLTRQVEDFQPISPKQVRMYVCGMTIYDFCHIGHARMMMAFDVVQRWFKSRGYTVIYARNITDIDDKIINRALERGIPIRELTDEMTAAMHHDIANLGIEPPTFEPRATDYVPQMLAIVDTLIQKGLAYQSANGDSNYSVRKFPSYGKLSGKSLDDLRSGERVGIDQDKQDPLDFVLWKSAKASEPNDAKWDSAQWGYTLGIGRPGWHIECSAMSAATLGETFDIHGGGADLQFPHHENEIAQSEGANGKPLANYWIHNGFVRVDGEKMSKSLGNFFTIREILEKYDAQTLRFFLIRTHYRSALNYSDMHLEDAKSGLKRLYTALNSFGYNESFSIKPDWGNPFAVRFKTAMDEDFGTPEAIAILFELATELNRSKDPKLADLLRALGGCLGILQSDPKSFLQQGIELDEVQINQLIEERHVAKKAKDFARSDEIRNRLLEKGIALKDGPNGTTWESISK